MLVALTTDDLIENELSQPLVGLVGGKAASLWKLYSSPGLTNHVPPAFALTVEFFESWTDEIISGCEWQKLNGESSHIEVSEVIKLCNQIKEKCKTLPLSQNQEMTLRKLREEMVSWGTLAAVRSSTPEEDGESASFAGAFETKLGVTTETLETAVRDCFASAFDYKAFCYNTNSTRKNTTKKPTFAAVVMEMVDSYISGVAFSANPLNSDLDELVIDSSFGLGESVVDGSIEPDHFLWDKIGHTIIEKKIGDKTQEKKLAPEGGIELYKIDKEKRTQCTLSDKQIKEVADLVCLIELTYGMPMDIEWAYTISKHNPTTDVKDDSNDKSLSKSPNLELKLLQARPITTLFHLDEAMLTLPGSPRVLYFDFNIVSEATTTSPFTHLDMELYTKMSGILMGCPKVNFFPENPRMFFFNSSTRQYANMSLIFKFVTPAYCANLCELMDPYLSDIFKSNECHREKYRSKALPEEMTFYNAWWYLKQFPILKLYKTSSKFKSKSKESKESYLQIYERESIRFKKLCQRGLKKEEGFHKYADELFGTLTDSINEELGALGVVLPLFKELDDKRRNSPSQKERAEYDALCGGYVGDELMEINIAIFRLAKKLSPSIWTEYSHANFRELARRIEANLEGRLSDISDEFLSAWKVFMNNYGFDGKDQMFVSSPRYFDSPEILLARMSHSVGEDIKDPAMIQHEQFLKRQKIMAIHVDRAKQQWYNPFTLSSIEKRNAILDHLMWMRNAPKIHLSRVCGTLRQILLDLEDAFIEKERLREKGDIFHLSMEELDRALQDEAFDLMAVAQPRKVLYKRAKAETICPLLVDSRGRILKPDRRVQGDEPGTLLGSPLSPGVAIGKVRIVKCPTDVMKRDEVLVAYVTDPSWTPLFVGASAIILQIGGLLQHGALCAREYGKPAVSGIEVMTNFKTGMTVSVDGNSGIVKIIDEGCQNSSEN